MHKSAEMGFAMETIDYSLTLSTDTPGMVLAGGILALSVFLVMFIVIKKRWQAKVIPFFMALVVFSLVRIFVMLIESALMLIPSIDAAFEYNTAALSVIDCMLAAVGYMAARWAVARIIDSRFDSRGDVYMAGLGLGFGDALLYGITTISNYVWCIAIDNGNLAQAFEGLTESDALMTFQSMSDLFYAPSILWLIMGVSTVIDMVLHLLLTTVIYGVEKRQIPSMWHAWCAVIYVAVLLPFQLYDSASMTSITVWFGIKLVVFLAAAYYVSKNLFDRIEFES